ncbi:MAG: FAD-dependent oxidoreductase [Clostridiales bacterium]|nr:FAD-dependent oxidoreductase [Clostridiales bacterium]
MKRYAIIGFGCAGFHAAKSIRQLDAEGRITVFNDTGQPPFNPMLSTYYASNKLELDGVFPFGTLEEIQEQWSLDIHNNVQVDWVDATSKAITLQDGSKHSFDSILIATGARAIVPPSFRKGGGDYFLMRTLADAQRLRTKVEEGGIKRATVVGGSMVGIKVAELLHENGIETTIVDAASYLFPLAAYESVAKVIQQRLEKQGIKFLFGAQVSTITKEGVVLGDGNLLESDIVCLCIGTSANVELVANTKVVEDSPVKVNRGIVVDMHMQTTCPGIYAAGDCCEGINLQTGKTQIIGLWANAAAQGSCAGRNMAGKTTVYYGNILHNITHFMGMDFIGLGDPTLPGERHTFKKEGLIIEAVLEGDRINSINIFGNYKISGILKNHLTKLLIGGERKLSIAQQGLLANQGLSWEFIKLIGGEI